jgi:hypothetical protein
MYGPAWRAKSWLAMRKDLYLYAALSTLLWPGSRPWDTEMPNYNILRLWFSAHQYSSLTPGGNYVPQAAISCPFQEDETFHLTIRCRTRSLNSHKALWQLSGFSSPVGDSSIPAARSRPILAVLQDMPLFQDTSIFFAASITATEKKRQKEKEKLLCLWAFC